MRFADALSLIAMLPLAIGSSSAFAGGDTNLAADFALRMLGTPYRYGGADPANGFDCSGLVFYSYGRAGINVPRSTVEQRRALVLVPPSRLRRGDLLFFDRAEGKKTHVGVYIGGGRFVHAPSSGKAVRVDRVDQGHWREHLAEARRWAH